MKLKTKLLSIIAPAAVLTTVAPIAMTSCGVSLTTQVKFGNSSTQLCGYHPCYKTGYDSYYATTKITLILTGDETVTLKASNISITCNGTEYQCKGFATLGTTSETQSLIESISTEYKFTATNSVASYVMFDNDMWEKYSTCTTATAKINSTSNIPFNTYTDIKFSI